MKKIFILLATASFLGACTSAADQQAAIEAAKQATLDSINNVNTIRQQAIDSMKEEQRQSVSYNNTQSSGAATPEEKKKGLNNAAKGALIGAGAGAITGALVDKKRGEGAIVGGLIGAGAGAVTGAVIDKNKKKKEAQK